MSFGDKSFIFVSPPIHIPSLQAACLVYFMKMSLYVFLVFYMIRMRHFVNLAITRLWWVHVDTLSCLSVHEVSLSSQCGADVIFIFAAGYTRMLLWTLCSTSYWFYLHCRCWLGVQEAEFCCFLVKLMPVKKVVKKLCLLPHYKIQGNRVEFNNLTTLAL